MGSFGVDTPVTRHELVLYLYPEGDGLLGIANYNTDLFDEATIAALFERYVALLRRVVADPDVRLSAVDLLTDQEHATLRRFGDGDQGADDTVVPSTWRLLTDRSTSGWRGPRTRRPWSATASAVVPGTGRPG